MCSTGKRDNTGKFIIEGEPIEYKKECLQCGETFVKSKSCALTRWGDRKFCNRKCMGDYNKGVNPFEGMDFKHPRLGKKFPKEHNPRWKGDFVKICPYCSKEFTVRSWQKIQKYCSSECHYTDRTCEENRGKSRKQRTGKQSKIRSCQEYKRWRRSVLARDNYTCQSCGQIGGRLQVDHIKPFKEYPELGLDIDNGRTLCEKCHRRTPTYGFRKNALFNEQTKTISECPD